MSIDTHIPGGGIPVYVANPKISCRKNPLRWWVTRSVIKVLVKKTVTLSQNGCEMSILCRGQRLWIDSIGRLLPNMQCATQRVAPRQGCNKLSWDLDVRSSKYFTRKITSKKFVRATRPIFLCASTKNHSTYANYQYMLWLSYWPGVLHVRNSTGHEHLSQKVEPLP